MLRISPAGLGYLLEVNGAQLPFPFLLGGQMGWGAQISESTNTRYKNKGKPLCVCFIMYIVIF